MTTSHRPGNGGGTDKPKSYKPEGEALEQLKLANTLVGIAIIAAGACIAGAKMFDMHPLGRLYGLLWVLIGIVSAAGFATKDTYPSEAEVWKVCNYKLILSVISFVLSMAVWLIPVLAY